MTQKRSAKDRTAAEWKSNLAKATRQEGESCKQDSFIWKERWENMHQKKSTVSKKQKH